MKTGETDRDTCPVYRSSQMEQILTQAVIFHDSQTVSNHVGSLLVIFTVLPCEDLHEFLSTFS